MPDFFTVINERPDLEMPDFFRVINERADLEMPDFFTVANKRPLVTTFWVVLSMFCLWLEEFYSGILGH